MIIFLVFQRKEFKSEYSKFLDESGVDTKKVAQFLLETANLVEGIENEPNDLYYMFLSESFENLKQTSVFIMNKKWISLLEGTACWVPIVFLTQYY